MIIFKSIMIAALLIATGFVANLSISNLDMV
jgi:hypothetical protein